MTFQIKNEPNGYLLEVYTSIFNNVGYFQWVPLRMFYLQGDAFLYRDHWAPRLSEENIKHMAKHYNPNDLYGMSREHTWRVVRRVDEEERA